MAGPEHAKLHVYARALDAAEQSDAIAGRLPAARSELREQLRRASISVALNIAEGAGEFSGPEKARFYRMARRSSAECLAILDLIERLTSGIPVASAREPLLEVGAMLTTMIRRNRPSSP